MGRVLRRRIRKAWPVPDSRFVSRASSGSVPLHRTSAGADDSQSARPKAFVRNRSDQGFVEILDRLEEVALTEDEVGIVRFCVWLRP